MDIARAFNESWEAFKRYPLPLMLVHALGSLISSAASGLLTGNHFAGFAVAADKALRGEEPKLEDTFKGFDNFGDKLIAGLVFISGAVVCGVGALVTGVLFLFAPFIVQREGLDWKEACTRSKDLALANLGQVIVLWLAVSGLNLLGVMACFVGVFATAPLSLLMCYHCYLQLAGEL